MTMKTDVCCVLVGNTTKGNSEMNTRPVAFDSTTDRVHMTVTYHEYLITYKFKKKSPKFFEYVVND